MMTKTLFVAWQDAHRNMAGIQPSRLWFPIGRLDAVPGQKYTFRYIKGAQQAQSRAGFQPLDIFPQMNRIYESSVLFPVFSNRIPSPKRNDYASFLSRHGLTPSQGNPFEILSVSGGERQTDNLELFPKIEKQADGSFACRFFVHGWRHLDKEVQNRIKRFQPGDALQVALEINNPVTECAIQLQTQKDYHVIGWAPRYLLTEMLQALAKAPADVTAHVVRYNPAPAPHNQRILVQLEGCLPEEFIPMSSEIFQNLSCDA